MNTKYSKSAYNEPAYFPVIRKWFSSPNLYQVTISINDYKELWL